MATLTNPSELAAGALNYNALDREIKRQFKTTQVPHSEILDGILTELEPVDTVKGAKPKELLIITVQEVLRACRSHGWDLSEWHQTPYVFNGGFWQPVDPAVLKKFLSNCAKKIGVCYFTAENFKFQDDLVKQFSATAFSQAAEKRMDTVLINLLNGTLEISGDKHSLRAPNVDDRLKYQLGFNYDPNAEMPLFLNYLHTVLPDKDCQKILAEAIGSIFIRTGVLKLEKIVVLLGPGANGKSVLSDIINALLGSENVSSFSLEDLTDGRNGSQSRAELENKLVNFSTEMSKRISPHYLKILASGEPITVRRLYCAPYDMRDYAKIFTNCNELPAEVERSHGFFRRWLIIPFNVTIPKHLQDKRLAQKIIEKELPAILNWALEGLLRLLAQGGFTESAAVEEQVRQYSKETDSVQLFLEDKGLVESDNDYMLLSAILNDYQTHCKTNGYRPVSRLNLSKRLNQLGFTETRKAAGMAFNISKKQWVAE
jgi:putative DNA primase/helicase